METNLIRKKFLDYFIKHDHHKISSSSLVPDDPTLLFVNAGMVQFKPVFQGLSKIDYSAVTTAQCCVRAGGKHNDLSQVGKTSRHHTFFEMLGNFSFGKYSKAVAIDLAWRFLTEELKIPKEKLWVTVFHSDEESFKIWQNDIGIAKDRIIKCGAEDNFWSMGATGPCGPCTEIFYDHGPNVTGGLPGSPDADGDRYVEIWNLVFMQHDMQEDGSLVDLPLLCVDTGMGLERIAAVMQNVSDNYLTDVFVSINAAIKEKLGVNSLTNLAYRVIADHLRTMIFLIADGVIPGNEGRGYVLRRIIRRAIRYAYQSGVREEFLSSLVIPCLQIMQAEKFFTRAWEKRDCIIAVIEKESLQFSKTIAQGMQFLSDHLQKKQNISAEIAFKLHDTHGFPLDLTEDVAQENGLEVDVLGFKHAMEKQKNMARSGHKFKQQQISINSSQKATTFLGEHQLHVSGVVLEIFVNNDLVDCITSDLNGILVLDKTTFYAESGGQVGDVGFIKGENGLFQVLDTQSIKGVVLHFGKVVEGFFTVQDKVDSKVDAARFDIMANHTATHLLHAALRQVLGDSVVQKGSLVNSKKLRFDFAYAKSLTKEQLSKVESLVNQWVLQDLQSKVELMPIEKAQQQGALALFGDKYSKEVRVVSYGDCSKELCGGTHLKSTSFIGSFVLFADTAIASGIRRIEAVTRLVAYEHNKQQKLMLHLCAEKLSCKIENIEDQINLLQHNNFKLKNEVDSYILDAQKNKIREWQKKYVSDKSEVMVFVEILENYSMSDLRELTDQIKNIQTSCAFVLLSIGGEKVSFICAVSKDLHDKLDARKILDHIKSDYNCSGGGRRDFVQGAIVDVEINKLKLNLTTWLNASL